MDVEVQWAKQQALANPRVGVTGSRQLAKRRFEGCLQHQPVAHQARQQQPQTGSQELHGYFYQDYQWRPSPETDAADWGGPSQPGHHQISTVSRCLLARKAHGPELVRYQYLDVHANCLERACEVGEPEFSSTPRA
jgi:hypothetical protein